MPREKIEGEESGEKLGRSGSDINTKFSLYS
jgi:hypothetical protein